MPGIGINTGIGMRGSAGGGSVIYANGLGQLFDGIEQYAFVADNGDLDINKSSTFFSLSARITTGSDINTLQWVLGKNVSGSINGRYGFFISVNTLRCLFQSTGGANIVDDNMVLATNTEYLVAMVIDLVNSKIYFLIDGVLQNTSGTSFTGTAATMIDSYEFYVGAGSNVSGLAPAGFFGGRIKDTRVYHKDIRDNMSDLAEGKELGDEVAWWNLPTLTGFGETAYNLTGVELNNIIVLGDSTIFNKPGYNAVSFYLPTQYDYEDVSNGGDTIDNQKTAYSAIDSTIKSNAINIFCQIGLNDLDPAESAATALLRYQSLVDTIKAGSPNAALTLGTMIPVKTGLTNVYGIVNGQIAYQKWLDMNEAIEGNGANAIIGADFIASEHTDLLNDGDGNLKAIYDIGDGVHETDEAREIIADVWTDVSVI